MNTTANPTTVANAQAQSGNAFSKASMIGMFITLQICQLTQPYGSLLFANAGGALWRFNPVSSFAEACIVFYYLSRTILQSRRVRRKELVLRLRQTAGALLLIRSTNADEDGAALLKSLLSDESSNSETEGLLQQVDPAADDNRGDVGPEEEDIADNTLVAAASTTPSPDLNWHPSLESGNRVLSADDGPVLHSAVTSRTVKKIRSAFGSNTLARKDFRVDIFTAFAEFCVIVKLLAITGNGWFCGAGFLLVLGWAGVQSLLLLFHIREMDELELKDTLALAGRLHTHLWTQSWMAWDVFYIALHLPFFGYLAYLLSFHPRVPPEATGKYSLLRGFDWLLNCIVAGVILVTIMHGASMASSSIIQLSPYRFRALLDKILFRLYITIVFLWVFISVFSVYYQACAEFETTRPEDPICPFSSSKWVFWYHAFGLVFNSINKPMRFLVTLKFIIVAYVNLALPAEMDWDENDRDSTSSFRIAPTSSRRGALILNTALVVVIFVVYLVKHDNSQSYLPNWTDPFG